MSKSKSMWSINERLRKFSVLCAQYLRTLSIFFLKDRSKHPIVPRMMSSDFLRHETSLNSIKIGSNLSKNKVLHFLGVFETDSDKKFFYTFGNVYCIPFFFCFENETEEKSTKLVSSSRPFRNFAIINV